jgi:hypothetical protein
MASIEFRPAVRNKTRLVICIAGATGSGKTRSALELARGLAGGDDEKIKAIDTENGRLLMFAPPAGQKPGKGTFGFLHAEMQPPFSPMAFRENIEAFNQGCDVGIIDSFAHEWNGDGGMHDMQVMEMERMIARNQNLDREAISSLAWKQPKFEHRKLVSKMLQLPCFLILCMRAEEKLLIKKVPVNENNPNGPKKTVFIAAADRPIKERWVFDCDKRLPYELTMSFLVTPDNPGVPIPLKLNEEHKELIPLDRKLSEETGRRLREWAHGGASVVPPATTADDLPEAWFSWTLEECAINRANGGLDCLRAWWKTLSKEQRKELEPKLPELQEIANKKAP